MPFLLSTTTGLIDVDTFFGYLEWPRNGFADHLFVFMGAIDEDGQVDFGDFVKVSLACVTHELITRIADALPCVAYSPKNRVRG